MKINDIKIKNPENYTKEAVNIHKTILTAVKFLNVFQYISINSATYGNFFINTITLAKNNIKFISPFVSFKATLNPDIKKSFINFSYIKIPKYNIYLTDTLVNLVFNNQKITAKGKGFYNGNKFLMVSELKNNNILKTSLSFKNFAYSNIFFNTDIKNFNINAFLNLNIYTYKIDGTFGNADIDVKNTKTCVKNGKFQFKNGKLKFHSEYVTINKFKKIHSISLYKNSLYYSFDSNLLICDSEKIGAVYMNYIFNSYKNELILKNRKNFNFKTQKTLIRDKQNELVLNNTVLNVFNNYTSYSTKHAYIKNKNIYLQTADIKGNLQKIFTKKIEGTVYSYKTVLNDITADIKEKKLDIKEAEINSVKIKNIIFKNKKLSFVSNTLFNKNIKEILQKFLNVKIPITQIAGENSIASTIDFNNGITSSTKVKTTLSLLKLFDFDLFVPKAVIDITNTTLNFYTQNAKLYLQKQMPLKFTGTGIIDFKKENLVMSGNIDFKINKIINLHNYKETAVIDFNKGTLKAKNSTVFIDFNTKLLIINRLKKLIKYTTFRDFVTDGLLLITFSDTTDITSYLLLKLPILYKHSNLPVKKLGRNVINKIFLNISINKNTVDIFNKNIDINVKNNKINVYLKNLDINLYPLEKLILDTNSTNDLNYSIKLYANNSNLMYKNHKFLSRTATVTYKNGNIKFNSVYRHSYVKGYTRQGYLLLEGKNFSNTEFRAFLPTFDFFSKISLDFIMVKSPDNFYTGKIYINNAVVRELKSLNNIIAFINTIPSLLSLSSPGFSSKGYKIRKGYINYLLYKKILYIKDAKIYGDNLDFFAKGYVDFKKNYIFLKVTADMKMKLKKIPIIGKGLSYLLFGKDGSINVKMIVKGNINNPKVKEDIGKDILISPFTLFKRVLTLPFNLF